MSFLVGLVVGGLAGAAVAALYTPGGLREEIEELWKLLPAEFRRTGERAQDDVVTRIVQGRDAYRNSIDAARERLERELREARSGK